ncbi:MFS transporter [Nocardia sp. NPDC057227]|uniref:MFS transporter n=1 Tax=Nocardia sp. NPDC057227 TaxID=3346056 RepID=UPI00363A4820
MYEIERESTLGRVGPYGIAALLTTVFLVQFLVALDVSLVNIALPDIAAELGFGAADLQWVVAAYLLTFAGFLLLGGRAGDLYGRRAVLVGGLLVFGVASVAGGLACSPALLVAARAVQGLGAAFVAPASLALINTEVPEALRGRALGLWSAAGAGGGAVGVVLSGVLTETLGWRSVMFVNVPIVVIALVAVLRGVRRGRSAQPGARLDRLGAVLVTAGVAALVQGVTEAGSHGWGSGRALAGFGAAVVLLVAFVVTEARVRHPLVPLELFRHRGVLGANLFGLLLSAGQLAAFYFASLTIQQVWGVSPIVTGLMFLPFCAFVVAGIVAGLRLEARFGVRLAIAVLGTIGAGGLAVFALIPDHTAFWSGVFLPSLLAGSGIGGSLVLVSKAATAGIPEHRAGLASAVLNSSRQLGGTIGLAVLVTVATHSAAGSGAATPALAAHAGYTTGFAVAAVLLLAGVVLAVLVLPSKAAAPTELPAPPTQVQRPVERAESAHDAAEPAADGTDG